MDDFRELLLASQKENKSVQLYVNGQAIPMLVTAVGLEFVEGKSREFTNGQDRRRGEVLEPGAGHFEMRFGEIEPAAFRGVLDEGELFNREVPGAVVFLPAPEA